MIWQNLLSHDWLFILYTVGTGIIAGCIAAISGFGIGSLLTPLLSIKFGTKIAIAAVVVPHFIGTFIRFWILRSKIDKQVFIHFGIASIIGGLIGALLFWKTTAPALTLIFGLILIFASLMEFTGLAQKLRLGKTLALIGGAISGFLGGLVGNQGGIRSAALLSFNIDRETFVATATAIGLVVDVIRMPVYFVTQGKEIIINSKYIIVATIGVIIGTWIGIKFLKKIPKDIFRLTVATLILFLGIFMLYQALFYHG
jgi:uncharacterized membrane protein YfcA